MGGLPISRTLAGEEGRSMMLFEDSNAMKEVRVTAANTLLRGSLGGSSVAALRYCIAMSSNMRARKRIAL